MAATATSSDSESNQSIANDSYTICSFVDEVESRVEMLRRQATSLIGEKQSLLVIIDQLKNDSMKCNMSPDDFQELVANMDRMKARCEAVQVEVHTVRDEGQIQALDKVNSALEELRTRLFSEETVPNTAIKQAHTYLNACLPEAFGAVDTRFQSMVLGCALDDQKSIRRRLESLVRKCHDEPESSRHLNSNRHSVNSASLEQSNNATANVESVAHTEVASDVGVPQTASRVEADDAGRGDTDSDSISNNVKVSNNQENFLTEEFYSTPKDSIALDGRV